MLGIRENLAKRHRQGPASYALAWEDVRIQIGSRENHPSDSTSTINEIQTPSTHQSRTQSSNVLERLSKRCEGKAPN